jgi:hypothetical protein
MKRDGSQSDLKAFREAMKAVECGLRQIPKL